MGELAKREDRLSKFLDILNPDITEGNKPRLGKVEKEIWEAIQYAYSLRVLFHSPDKIRRAMMHYPSPNTRSYSSACQIYQDMEYIYGKSTEVNKDAQRRVLLEFAHNRIHEISANERLEEEAKEKLIEKWFDKIVKLSDLTEGNALPPVMPPVNVNFVTGNDTVQMANVTRGKDESKA